MDLYEQEQADKAALARYVDEDGLGWAEVEGEPGSFAVVDTKAINPKEETMAGATLTKEAQASGKSRQQAAKEKDSKATSKPKTRVAVREIPEEFIATVVAGVRAGKKYSEIETEMKAAKTKTPKGYKSLYPAIRTAAIRHFGSVAAAREAAGKKNAA